MAFVCTHLSQPSVGLGFNWSEEEDSPFPDAWCDDCEIIRTAHNGWNDESQEMVKISLICSSCYQRTRIRNTRPVTTLEDLSSLRWKCGSCDDWHTGPCLDFGYDEPYYWRKEYEGEKSHLNEDFCSIDDRDFFIRGVIELPVIGSEEVFRWGVWGSLSRENLERLLKISDSQDRVELPPMFSWLSTQIQGYPETLNLKMYAHIQESGQRSRFELEPTDHPLTQEQQKGISPSRIEEIMVGRFKAEKS